MEPIFLFHISCRDVQILDISAIYYRNISTFSSLGSQKWSCMRGFSSMESFMHTLCSTNVLNTQLEFPKTKEKDINYSPHAPIWTIDFHINIQPMKVPLHNHLNPMEITWNFLPLTSPYTTTWTYWFIFKIFSHRIAIKPIPIQPLRHH